MTWKPGVCIMASKLSLTLRLSIYFSRDHSTLPAEIGTHSEVPGRCSLQVHKDLFAIKRQTPLIALFPDAFQLDYGAYLTRAQIQLLEIYRMVFRCFEKFARVKPCSIQFLCASESYCIFRRSASMSGTFEPHPPCSCSRKDR